MFLKPKINFMKLSILKKIIRRQFFDAFGKMFRKCLTKMSHSMSIIVYSDSLVHYLNSELPGCVSVGSGLAFLADYWREPLHTLPTSIPGRG
ncbi:hypothetical protein TNCT_248881 [Trichonephila clavata]|uniref:Uncharacterized protein n=1 Tax=Trichonephila clavata TaxID=2740835 RepID=A0A8X6LIV3_TRICU|nr:hypothetical protein TNCT_248881 [Trichonephila clavata]